MDGLVIPDTDKPSVRISYAFAAFLESFALARLLRVVGIAVCGVGHGGGAIGRMLIIASICFYLIAFPAAAMSVSAISCATTKKLPITILCGAILTSILVELRDVSFLF